MQLSYAAVDDTVLTPEVREPSASDIADMAEPALTTLDAPHLQDMELLPSFKDEWAPLTVESIPEDMLTSSDIFTLEDLEETMPPGAPHPRAGCLGVAGGFGIELPRRRHAYDAL